MIRACWACFGILQLPPDDFQGEISMQEIMAIIGFYPKLKMNPLKLFPRTVLQGNMASHQDGLRTAFLSQVNAHTFAAGKGLRVLLSILKALRTAIETANPITSIFRRP